MLRPQGCTRSQSSLRSPAHQSDRQKDSCSSLRHVRQARGAPALLQSENGPRGSALRLLRYFSNPDGEIALLHLAMKQVHENFQIGSPDFSHDGVRLFLAIEKKAWNVAQRDWLDEQFNASRVCLLRRPCEIRSIDAEQVFAVRILWGQCPPSRVSSGGHSSARAYSIARRNPSRNSCSRPGNAATPRSPAFQSPGGELKRTWRRPCSLSSAASVAAGYS